jgi:hypothetical protein
MTAYFLFRDSVPLAHAALAAIDRKDLPEVIAWLTGSAEVQYCLLDAQEFERVKTYPGAIVLSSDLHSCKEIAIAFGPRPEWPEEFDSFRDFHEEAEKRREERENITEKKWLEWDTRPIDQANFVLRRASERKIRLFAVACCDLAIRQMVDPRSRRAVEVALRHADRTANDEELTAASLEAREVTMPVVGPRAREALDQTSREYWAAVLACSATSSLDRTPTPDKPDGWLSLCAAGTTSDFLIWHTMRAAGDDPLINPKLTAFLRDICGNPFRKVLADPAWRAPGVKAMAKSIYDLKAFDRLPQLADALEEAGCDEPAILDHCRRPGSHVRGCWVVDLMLGYERFSL